MQIRGSLLTVAGTVALGISSTALDHHILRATDPGELEGAVYDLGIPHAECSFFGPRREEVLKSSLTYRALEAARRSALTSEVTAALPQAQLPFRSRAGTERGEPSGGTGFEGDSIDDFVFGAMRSAGITPAPGTSDAEFLRRVTLDLTGRIPTLEEVQNFLQNGSPDKRRQAVDRLLETPQWADRWAMFFGDLYRNTIFTTQVIRYADGRDAFHLFLLEALRENMPYDEMVRRMLASNGANDGRSYPLRFDSYDQYIETIRDYQNNPVTANASSYLVGGITVGGPRQDSMDTMAATVSRDFLGISHMDCVLCHDGAGHLDSLSLWGTQAKRLEGWQLASFFSRTLINRLRRIPPPPDSERPVIPRWWIVSESPSGGGYLLNTDSGNRPARTAEPNGGQLAVMPQYPFTGGGPADSESFREGVGRLLTSDVQFSRAIVNYVWKEFFGRGFVDPPDQFDLARLDPTNPPEEPWEIQPSHPELLEFLSQGFVENGLHLKWLMAKIANSEAYQLSSRYDGAWNASYEAYFARHQVERLSAEELHDAITVSSGVLPQYVVSPGIGIVSYAMRFPDVQLVPFPRRARRDDVVPEAIAMGFLDAFLRGNRDDTPRSNEPSIIQALHLMNSPLVTDRSTVGGNALLAAILDQPDDVLVQVAYLRILSRPPTQEELSAAVSLLANGDRAPAAEDLIWSLYNKVDFIFNY